MSVSSTIWVMAACASCGLFSRKKATAPEPQIEPQIVTLARFPAHVAEDLRTGKGIALCLMVYEPERDVLTLRVPEGTTNEEVMAMLSKFGICASPERAA